MSRRSRLVAACTAVLCTTACGRAETGPFVSLRSPVLALTHARLIDGTGRPARDGQTIVIKDGQIAAVGDDAHIATPAGATFRDVRGRTVIPGLVGMHDHLFYEIDRRSPPAYNLNAQSPFAKLYLGAGVTTIRTAGTGDLSGDLALKQRIDDGAEPGPKIHISSPYLIATTAQPDPERIAAQVAAWADQGVTSFKAYTNLRAVELQAAIRAAHERGLRVTGHLCSIGYREAASLGIDNIEHGLPFDTEFYSGKQKDVCPPQGEVFGELLQTDVSDGRIREMMGDLIRHGVAVTSTLAIIESFAGKAGLDPRVEPTLSSRVRGQFLIARAAWTDENANGARTYARILKKEMEFERAFVAAGGRLMAGVDPTGWGGVVAGFGDQREVELLVQAGFSAEAAIKIATANGASFLYESKHIGTIAPGKQADLVVVRGDLSARIADIKNVEMVIKDGVVYDPDALVAAAAGAVGAFEIRSLLRWPANAALVASVMVVAVIGRRRIRKRRPSVR